MARIESRSASRRLLFILGVVLVAAGVVQIAFRIVAAVSDAVSRPSVRLDVTGIVLVIVGALLLVMSNRVPKNASSFGTTGLSFAIGDTETHEVEYLWDQIWGGVSIRVDGVVVRNDIQVFSARPIKAWEFDVGEQERHRVRIEKRRALLFPALRPQPLTAYVDGQVVATSPS